MKAFILAVAVGTLATPARAGGPTVVDADPVPAAAPSLAAHDWSGIYLGLSYGKTSADVIFVPGVAYDFNDGNVAGLYAGYLFQHGRLVYGGELAYGKVSDTFIGGSFGDDDEIEFAVDLKGRLGYAVNRALVYGVLGYSKSNYVEPPGGDWDTGGVIYGLGAEFAASQRLTIGLEYLSRDVSGNNPAVATQEADINLDSLSLRVGLSF